MKKLLVVCGLLLAWCVAPAQKVYFVYIQSDNNVPFFVKVGDQVTSSNPTGYLIVPKLVDSVYQFTIGKTGQAGTEARFSITVNQKDHGYLLREADGKFSLFDLQTMTSLQPIASATLSNEPVAKRTDAFSVLLAQAANDPSLLDVHTTATAQTETTKKPEPTPAVVITTKESEKTTAAPQPQVVDTTATKETDVAAIKPEKKELPAETKNAEPQKKDTVEQTTAQVETPPQTAAADSEEAKPYKRSVVTRKSESSTSEGFGLTFLDKTDEGVDTVRILIPNPSIVFQKSDDADSKRFLNISSVDSTKSVAESSSKDLNSLPDTKNSSDSSKIDSTKKTNSVDVANKKLRAAEMNKRKMCPAEASEKDFFKLRKNMAAKESEEAMIDEAKKFFKKSCFSTEQIKNLSSLFLTSSGKYHFFDAAYGHVSNQEQYGTLQSELDDAYYANRFKALIANQ